jgi:hypothetical protein
MAVANRISRWGIASLVLLVAGYAFVDYSGYLYEQHRKMLFRYWAEVNQFALVIELAAVGCGIVAVRGQSYWWGLSVAAAALLSLVFFFGDM